MIQQETIVALATPSGAGAIAIVRLSGVKAIEIAAEMFESVSGKDLKQQDTHTVHLGNIQDGSRTIDQVLATIFKNPYSYTGEDVVEFSCHGSSYIQQEIIQLALKKGARMAEAGEFTLRSFLNGKMDLSQAEAVADLIASDNAATHQIAMQQMRGGFSDEIQVLRQELLNFASLIELELDFSDEDVEFANREEFQELVSRITTVLKRLIDSFATGSVLKQGIPVAIVGEPNVGKSTLLNALLMEERAIVSDIPGTTRDTIEDELSIGGIGFRFIDTAGIRETTDTIEGLGIQKTFEKMQKAQVVLYLLNSLEFAEEKQTISELVQLRDRFPQKPFVVVCNKMDMLNDEQKDYLRTSLASIPESDIMEISAKKKIGLEELKNKLLEFVNTGALRNNETIVTNSRHYDSLLNALEEMIRVQEGLDAGLSGDLLAIDIRQALYHFGEITGEITNDELLGNIFSQFCIGK